MGADKAVKTLLEFGTDFDRNDLNEIIIVTAEWYVSVLRIYLDNSFVNATFSITFEETRPSDFVTHALRTGHRNVPANILAKCIIKWEATSRFGDERTPTTSKVECESEVGR